MSKRASVVDPIDLPVRIRLVRLPVGHRLLEGCDLLRAIGRRAVPSQQKHQQPELEISCPS